MKHDGFPNKYSLEHNQRKITQVPLTPKQVYKDQVRLQKESDQKKESEQKILSEKEKDREKEREAKKKERKNEKIERENKRFCSAIKRKAERKTNFYAKPGETKKALFLNPPMIVLMYKEAFLNTN